MIETDLEAASGEQVAWHWASIENKFLESWNQGPGSKGRIPFTTTYINGCYVTIDRDYETYHLIEVCDTRPKGEGTETWVTYMYVAVHKRNQVKAWEWCDPRPHKFFERGNMKDALGNEITVSDLMRRLVGWHESVI